MPAKYFPSLSPNGIDYNTLPNLGDIAQAPRGQDPMHYGFVGSKGPQSPFAPVVGQAADALMDPRLGMLPMVGGFKAAQGMIGGVGRRVADVASGIPRTSRLNTAVADGLKASALEREPLPYQQATTMRQPQGDQSMGKAITDLAASMGPGMQPWVALSLPDVLAALAQHHGQDLRQTAIRFAGVQVRASPRGWRYHPVLGFSQRP